jgi:hypothetical protein
MTKSFAERVRLRRPHRRVEDGPGRHANPELEKELCDDTLFAPRAVRGRHRCDQLLQVGLEAWSPGGSRFPAPQQPKPFPMPPMKVSGVTTVSSRRQSTSHARATSVLRVASSARRGLIFPLEVQRQLLLHEQILGGELRVRVAADGDEPSEIADNAPDCIG